MVTHPTEAKPSRTVHFQLPPGDDYVLKGFGGRYPLKSHTELTRRAFPELDTPEGRRATHYADAAVQPGDTIQLIRVYGANDGNGIPTLVSMAVSVAGSPQTVYTNTDLAAALIFLHPGVSVLTAEAAPTTLAQITAAGSFGELTSILESLSNPWNTSSFALDQNGNRIPNPYTAGDLYQYDLDPIIGKLRAQVGAQAVVNVNNTASLEGIRYNIADGVPYQTATTPSAFSPAPAAGSVSGYNVQLQDPGPTNGISAQIDSFDADNGFTISLILSNSYVRHCSAFVSFIGGDGVTALTVPDNLWQKLAIGAVWLAYKAWSELELPDNEMSMLFDTQTNTLKYLGTLSAESTFLGVPVSEGSSQFTFSLPIDQSDTVSKIRILVGSLGIPSGIDWDPKAAAIGIGMTAFFDLMIPTVSIVATVGMPDSDLFSTTFGKVSFFGPAVISIVLAVWDIISNPNMAGKDLTNLLTGIADSLMQNVLGAADVAAALAAVFGGEEVAEAIPIVGWALKAEAIEATIEQLAQTVGEVVGSERVTEFDLTVAMDDQFTLVPVDTSGFPETATHFTVTAQFSDVTGYVYTGQFPDPKVAQVQFTWSDMPVGGTVSFLVAFYSEEGYLVGKGESPVMANFITTGQESLVVPDIAITQLLYPLSADTIYTHQQLLQYANGAHEWLETSSAPSETAKDLGTGEGGNVLAALSGVTLNSDLGVLGYVWEASGQNVPLIGTTQPIDMQAYTFQNISFNSDPESALMFVAAGYSASPRLIYLRSAAAVDNGGSASAAANSFFYLDPVADADFGYNLRGIVPVTDPSVPSGSPKRIFDQSTDLSWGRFPSPLLPTSLAIHSNGVVVGVSNPYDKLLILNLPDAAAPTGSAPWSQVFSGTGTRPGLLSVPQLVAIHPNQTIYILEAGNQRIQAFSSGGHPVQAFPSLPTPYWIPLFTEETDPASVTYVAMSVEIKGYIYVLSIEENGYVSNQFRLDIYTPDGEHLLRQRDINVGSMTVDLWRNLYTQNYATILGPGNRTEPSVSEWVPSTPPKSGSRR